MKVNALINDLAKGHWAMSFDGLAYWAPLAHKLVTGQELKLQTSAGSILSVYDHQWRRVAQQEGEPLDVPAGSIAVIDMRGPLIKNGDMCIYGADDYVAALDQVEREPNFIGAIVYMEGPGGAVSAVSPFKYFGLRRQKSYGILFEQCCSAHLWSGFHFGDFFMAENDISAMIGCMGIVFTIRDNAKYLEGLGYKTHEIYADESEDKNLAVRLALEGKYEMIKAEMLSPMARKFQGDALALRPQMVKDAPGLLTGKTFFAEQALEYKLIDAIGPMEAAFARLQMAHEMKLLRK